MRSLNVWQTASRWARGREDVMALQCFAIAKRGRNYPTRMPSRCRWLRHPIARFEGQPSNTTLTIYSRTIQNTATELQRAQAERQLPMPPVALPEGVILGVCRGGRGRDRVDIGYFAHEFEIGRRSRQ